MSELDQKVFFQFVIFLGVWESKKSKVIYLSTKSSYSRICIGEKCACHPGSNLRAVVFSRYLQLAFVYLTYIVCETIATSRSRRILYDRIGKRIQDKKQ